MDRQLSGSRLTAMTRFAAALFAGLLVFLGTAPGGGTAKPKGVVIVFHGQSFFEVRSSKGTNVVFDPHQIPEYGKILAPIKADLVLMSHQHNDHTQLDVIANKDKGAKIIPGWKGAGARATWNLVNETVKDVKIRSVGVYHDELNGLKHGKNTVFIIEVDGWKIAHLGDLGHLLTPGQVKQIGPVDVLMIPVGGVYALNGSEAKDVAGQLKPKEYIIPMHYGTTHFTDLLPPTEFLDHYPKRQVAIARENILVLNRDPDRPRPLIVVMHYWPRTKKTAD
jgi:L-ascorbate metabolism protein UlaG (beta-lactamase superfamily)